MSGTLRQSRRHRTRIVLVLVVGVLAGLVVVGAVHLGLRKGDAASAAGDPSATPTAPGPSASPTPPPPLATSAPVKQGTVVADGAAGKLTADIPLGRTHTSDGAVAAFTAYASWLVGSPAAAKQPEQAAAAVGGSLIDATDARLLAGMQRRSGDGFDAGRGAYRVLGHAGDANAPREVMIEVTAPLTVGEKTGWRTIGGVVSWTPQGWQLVSIEPHAVPQPAAARSDVRHFTIAERNRTFAGLGWRAFRQPAGR